MNEKNCIFILKQVANNIYNRTTDIVDIQGIAHVVDALERQKQMKEAKTDVPKTKEQV